MTTKTKAEELASALTRADAVATQLTTRKDAAAELRRLAGVEAERDDYLTETRTLVRQNGEWQEKCDRLAAEVERLREDAERYRALRSTMGPCAMRSTAMPVVSCPLHFGTTYATPEAFDAAVDEARKDAE